MEDPQCEGSSKCGGSYACGHIGFFVVLLYILVSVVALSTLV